MTRVIPVTKTSLPPIQEYFSMIAGCWENVILTNDGPLVQSMESKLSSFLKAKNFLLTNNGTSALQLAIRALGIKKEIITTPFSYVATTSSILWEHCDPIFVDIDRDSYCIDVNKIEEKITSQTEAILAVHVYGNPSDVKQIQTIADRYQLKVIYDAAHAFGVNLDGVPITNFGDISILSFHATKLFHTLEGGGIVTFSDEIAEKLKLLRAFGHKYDDHFILGINAKMNEFQAAMGLCNIPYITSVRDKRKLISDYYDGELKDFEKVAFLKTNKDVDRNYAYYPIVFASEKICLNAQSFLKEKNIMTRRYFFPSLNTLPYIKYQSCPISEDICSRVLCIPLYSDLSIEDASYIIETLKESLDNL